MKIFLLIDEFSFVRQHDTESNIFPFSITIFKKGITLLYPSTFHIIQVDYEWNSYIIDLAVLLSSTHYF